MSNLQQPKNVIEWIAKGDPVADDADIGLHASPKTRRILEQITSSPPDGEPYGSRHTRRIQRRLALALPLAALAVVVGLTAHSTKSPNQPTSATGLFERLGAAAEASYLSGPLSSQYGYQRVRSVTVTTQSKLSPGPAGLPLKPGTKAARWHTWHVHQSQQLEIWMNGNGTGRMRVTRDADSFPTERDHAQWLLAKGAPLAPAGVSDMPIFPSKFRARGSTFGSGPGDVYGSVEAFSHLRQFPVSPGPLQRSLVTLVLRNERRAQKEYPGTKSLSNRGLDRAVIEQAMDVISQQPAASSQLRAGLYRVAARLSKTASGVRFLGKKRDLQGREGVATSFSLSGLPSEYSRTMIFNPKSGELLSSELSGPRGSGHQAETIQSDVELYEQRGSARNADINKWLKNWHRKNQARFFQQPELLGKGSGSAGYEESPLSLKATAAIRGAIRKVFLKAHPALLPSKVKGPRLEQSGAHGAIGLSRYAQFRGIEWATPIFSISAKHGQPLFEMFWRAPGQQWVDAGTYGDGAGCAFPTEVRVVIGLYDCMPY